MTSGKTVRERADRPCGRSQDDHHALAGPLDAAVEFGRGPNRFQLPYQIALLAIRSARYCGRITQVSPACELGVLRVVRRRRRARVERHRNVRCNAAHAADRRAARPAASASIPGFALLRENTGDAGEEYALTCNCAEVTRTASRKDALDRLESTLRLTIAEHAPDRVFVHAGVVG